MTRRLLPVFLSIALLGVLLATASARAEDLSVAGSNDEQATVAQAPDAESTDGTVAVTRSDGSTGHTKPPDPKEIRKLVGYMRDGMHRADQSEKQRQTKRVIQYRRNGTRK
jgi:hypothetical protein